MALGIGGYLKCCGSDWLVEMDQCNVIVLHFQIIPAPSQDADNISHPDKIVSCDRSLHLPRDCPGKGRGPLVSSPKCGDFSFQNLAG